MNRLQNYFPAQPEIQQNTIFYQELKPKGTWLSDDIALFYQFKTELHAATFLSLVPDGCIDLLFCCDTTSPSAFLWTSPFHRKKQPEFRRDCEYFGIRFFPEQNLVKLNYPMIELLDQQIPLTDVMSNVESLIEIMAAGTSFSERIEQIESFLKRNLLETGNEQKIVQYAIQKIYASRGLVNVYDLSSSIGYSEQHIRKRFEAIIGFSPKQFCQIVRFQNTLDRFLARDSPNLLDIIFENGYYDQAHFIKGFKKFMHLTPKQYKVELHSTTGIRS
ncbi:helix-turn-helix domain-containing protein [Neobacillus sp. Marseille-QA0830]